MSAQETTTETQVVTDLGTDHTVMYGHEATQLVVDGYKAIQSSFRHQKKIKRFTEGKLLVEVVHSPDWTMPNLLSAEELQTFQHLSREYLPESVLQAIWYILENVCAETRLMPVIVMDRTTGSVAVRLQ